MPPSGAQPGCDLGRSLGDSENGSRLGTGVTKVSLRTAVGNGHRSADNTERGIYDQAVTSGSGEAVSAARGQLIRFQPA